MSARTVLIIEDDVNLLRMLQMMLERHGFTVVLANRPQDGLKRALDERPDVTIVDLMMPEISGLEVIRRLRADPGGADLPILVLTARAQPLDRQAALAAGADAYLSKPVSSRTLLSKVEELAGRARPQPGGTQRLVVLLSLRGGVGVMTLAVNLALLLQRAPRGACLVELDRSGGHAGLHLKLNVTSHWGALLPPAEPPPGGAMDLLLRHESGLQVLAAPPLPNLSQVGAQSAGLPKKVMLDVLRTLRDHFSFTIVAAGPVLDEATLAALTQADSVLLVLAPEVSSAHTTAATLRALAGTPIDARVSLVMNHPSPLRPLPQAGLEHNLGRPIMVSVPFDENQILALARGVPLALGPTISPLVKAIRDLAVHAAGFKLQTSDLRTGIGGQGAGIGS